MHRDNLRLVQIGYPNISHDAALTAPATQQLYVHSITAYNGNASANNLGLAHSFTASHWGLYSIGASTTSVTATIQAGSSTTLFGTTNNYGIIVQGKSPFGLVTASVSQASTGSPVYSYQYWDGSTWQTLTLLSTPSWASTGRKAIMFLPPVDWAVGSGGAADDTLYSIRVRATTAPSQAVLGTAMKVCRVIVYRGAVATTKQLGVIFKTRPYLLEQGEAIIGFFSTADAGNSVEIAYQLSP